jgi:hypothetical protein
MATTTTDFNITVQLGKDNKEVTLYASDLDKVSANGMHFALPPDTTVTLGSLKDFIDWFNKQATTDIPDEAGADWPDLIKSIFNGVLNAQVAVTQFTFDLGPKDSKGKSPDAEFSLSVTGTAMDTATPPKPSPIKVGLFNIVGGGIGVTRTNASS